MKNLSRSVSLHFPQPGKMVKILQALIVLAVTFSLLGFPQAKPVNAATTVNLVAFADTWLRQDNPTYNYGGSATIQHSRKLTALNNSLFLWNLTSIPQGMTVTAASDLTPENWSRE